MNSDRREFIATCAALGTGAGVITLARRPRSRKVVKPPSSRVAVLRCDNHATASLVRALSEGVALFNLDVRGKTVLLKPNLVEHLPGRDINTDPRLVAAAADCFLRLRAGNVVVAEGPGHHRDTELLLQESGLKDQLQTLKIDFIDLNREDLVKTPLRAGYTGLGHLWLPRVVFTSDFVVSMPKIKTHHWAGVTLSMKNMFGSICLPRWNP